jgi:hypothetical protein
MAWLPFRHAQRRNHLALPSQDRLPAELPGRDRSLRDVEKTSAIISSPWSAMFPDLFKRFDRQLYHRPRRFSTEPPTGAAGPVFQRDAELAQALTNLIGQGEVFVLAGFGAKVDEKLN